MQARLRTIYIWFASGQQVSPLLTAIEGPSGSTFVIKKINKVEAQTCELHNTFSEMQCKGYFFIPQGALAFMLEHVCQSHCLRFCM